MKLNILLVIINFYSIQLFSQILTTSDIRQIAIEVNNEIKGVNFGNGIKAKGCFSFGRKLIYQYNVPQSWEPSVNIKKEIISNMKIAGPAKTYFLQNIDVDYHYYKGNSLFKKISIKSLEFSNYNFQLGEYISINNHIKAKEVNMKLKVPDGWEVKEGDRPNVVKKLVYDGSTYLILIKENATFFSRNQIKKMLNEKDFASESVQEISSLLSNPVIVNQSIVTIDTYPAFQFKIKGNVERTGIKISVIMKCWIVFYEDKIIFLQSMGNDNLEFRALEQLYTLITNSVIFPDQYN